MFERILVPLDGSTRAARALPIIARLAHATHGSVILVSVVNHFVLGEPSSTHNHRTLSRDDISMSEAEAYLEATARSPELAHVTVEKAILSGPVASTVLYAVTSCRADLIVISSHGRSGMMSKMLGSVSEKVVCRATIPVLLLREKGSLPLVQYPQTDREENINQVPSPTPAYVGNAHRTMPTMSTGLTRILVALNGTSSAHVLLNPAAELAAALASPYGGALHLARVVLPPEVVAQKHAYGSVAETMEQAQKSLAAVTSYLHVGLMAPIVAQYRLAVTWTVVESEQIAETLVHLAEHGEDVEGEGAFGDCDIIAMATHGLAIENQLTLGSVAAHVIALTHCPILLVRPTAQMQMDRSFERSANV
ncbi:universal stress protein [Dictyobacter arantiisoli]|uniref:UspA domain-containing protein n=1 Tax=Dictyobacter arantiisoli TaxID=2014874 RepID=A0A5A5TBA5_9CHLR|nr:universal stress protein [Dictyobacter arantiisoli]GCF08678.1 hypothetical protein KDI_22420 [Dictyobacter arantiisoli]